MSPSRRLKLQTRLKDARTWADHLAWQLRGYPAPGTRETLEVQLAAAHELIKRTEQVLAADPPPETIVRPPRRLAARQAARVARAVMAKRERDRIRAEAIEEIIRWIGTRDQLRCTTIQRYLLRRLEELRPEERPDRRLGTRRERQPRAEVELPTEPRQVQRRRRTRKSDTSPVD